MKGESLRERLTKEKQLPVADAVQIARDIASALAYAHKEGVIHRDVKPANIMLEEGPAVRPNGHKFKGHKSPMEPATEGFGD